MDAGFGVSGLVLDPLYFTANSGRFDKKGFYGYCNWGLGMLLEMDR